MARPNEGSVRKSPDGTWRARVRWTTEEGRPLDFKRSGFATKSEANEWKDKRRAELLEKGTSVVDARNLRFAELAEEFRKERLKPAVIRNGQKVSGALSDNRYSLRALVEHFGTRKVQQISNGDLHRYRDARLATPTKYGREREVASVNRELSLARTIFKFAIGRRWLTVSPFEGEPVIMVAAEKKRDRVLSADEMERLLEACRKPDAYGRNSRRRLYPLLVAAIHTAARRSELTKLAWRDVDWNYGRHGAISVTSRKGRVFRTRTIPLSPTLRGELDKLWTESSKSPDDLVFGYKWGPTSAFPAALKDAGITDYRWHDGRHLATTLMIEKARNPLDVMQITGHTQESTFRRYYNPRADSLCEVTEALG
jgi:integrase